MMWLRNFAYMVAVAPNCRRVGDLVRQSDRSVPEEQTSCATTHSERITLADDCVLLSGARGVWLAEMVELRIDSMNRVSIDDRIVLMQLFRHKFSKSPGTLIHERLVWRAPTKKYSDCDGAYFRLKHVTDLTTANHEAAAVTTRIVEATTTTTSDRRDEASSECRVVIVDGDAANEKERFFAIEMTGDESDDENVVGTSGEYLWRCLVLFDGVNDLIEILAICRKQWRFARICTSYGNVVRSDESATDCL